ncbi:hypothetical protein TELCIR_13436 [Teladorsagia circumcincta]|uniref:Uncharacterized protein n=1 Tax=Teladorsagia circumcincta TaxID=45464 RepID=A0A2G9U3U3_TELCI|nr:hypothetical protein TELCIR_13436 [Teladorsagia circumcincta]
METALLVLLNRIHAVKKLSGEILGVVRPAVMGGVSNYEVEILEFCLYAHATRTEITKQFHDHLVEGFFEHKQYVEDKANSRTISVDAARVFASIRDNGADSFRSLDHPSRRPTIDGLEGIRLRTRARRSIDQTACAPPLPPRTHVVTSNDSIHDDRSIFNEQRHNKSPIPTPITDLSDLQRF